MNSVSKPSTRKWLYREMGYLLLIFLYAIILLKITFYKEAFSFILTFTAKLFYLFMLPGYVLLLYKKEKVDFAIRLVIGISINLGLLLILSYYLGIIGFHIKYHSLIIPLLLTMIGIVLCRYRKKVEGIILFKNF